MHAREPLKGLKTLLVLEGPFSCCSALSDSLTGTMGALITERSIGRYQSPSGLCQAFYHGALFIQLFLTLYTKH